MKNDWGWTHKNLKGMVGSSGEMMIVNSGMLPCGICGKVFQANSVKCLVCKKWIHKGCTGAYGDLSVVSGVSDGDDTLLMEQI